MDDTLNKSWLKNKVEAIRKDVIRLKGIYGDACYWLIIRPALTNIYGNKRLRNEVIQ